MDKKYHNFQKDVETILNNEESEWKEVQQEWEQQPADEHLCRYKHYDAQKVFGTFWAKVTHGATNSQCSTEQAKEVGKRPFHFVSPIFWRQMVTVAASVIIIIGVFLTWNYYTHQEPSRIDRIAALPSANDSLPQLVMGNGSTFHIIKGTTAGGVATLTMDGTIVLHDSEPTQEKEPLMEEIIIPRGKMYKLQLFDGTKVLLDAESSIRFPSSFDTSRNVELKGQAYFEVAKDGRPFIVSTHRGTITVLGTSFSVSAYASQPFKVALNTGRIRFRNAITDATLTAGQTITCDETGRATITSVSSPHNTSWMEGIIAFNDMPLENIMNNIERMYDVNVHYSLEEIKQIRFTGECSRFHSVEEFLSLLSMTQDFCYIIDGRDIYINPVTEADEASSATAPK